MSHNGAIKSWSNLPVDILNVIIEHLYFDDQIRFRAVCKSWRWNTYATKSADQLPWLFVYEYHQYDKVSDFCYLYNPSNKTKYEIKKKLPFGLSLEDSKYGWILISKVEGKNPDHTLLFFYNPFTDETIKLPVLKNPLDYHQSRVTFSSNPTSKECVIFVVVREYGGHGWTYWELVKIYTCRPGDTRWGHYSCSKDFRGDILSLVCVDGVLYCASSIGDEIFLLSSFRIIAKKQEIVIDPIDVLSFAIPSSAIHSCRLIESDGNVLLTYCESDNCCLVFRVDFTEKKLVEFETLEQKTLCRGWEKCLLVPSMGELANTVHHNWFMNCDSYFYKAPETPLCPQPYAWINKTETPDSESIWFPLCPQPYGWINKTETPDSESIWIQPPLHFIGYQKITPATAL